MNKKTFVVLGAIVAAGSILAAPGGFRGSPHGSPHGGPRGPRGCSPAPRMGGGFRPSAPRGPAPRMGGFHAPAPRGPAPRMSGGFRPPVSHGPAPRMGGFCGPAPRMGGFHAPAPHGPPPRMGGFHAPFGHMPCGFRYPRGYHIGARHIAILPPAVLINDYYWTEEVFINGQYFILYCYPDGTKRFADGTIYCYI